MNSDYKPQWNNDHPDKVAEQTKRTSIKNADKIKVADQKYRDTHREQRNARARIYRQAHADEIRAKNRAYKARKRGAEGKHTATDVTIQYERQHGKCYYCGRKLGKVYHVDHVVPLSRGGSNDPSNLVVACPNCNVEKRNKMPHEWPKGGRLL